MTERKPSKLKISVQLLKIIKCLIEAGKDKSVSGMEVVKHTGLLSGTVYPILIRMEKTGWLIGTDENIDPYEIGRPRRRHFKLTDDGVLQGNRLMQEYSVEPKKYIKWKNSQSELLNA